MLDEVLMLLLSRLAWWAADAEVLEVVAAVVVAVVFFESIADGEPEKLLLMTLKMVSRSEPAGTLLPATAAAAAAADADVGGRTLEKSMGPCLANFSSASPSTLMTEEDCDE